MSKNKYYFDSENLEFVPIKKTFTQRIYGLSLFLISSIIIGSFITIILLNTDFIDTPKELVQAREINNYELQLRVLNKKLDQVESTLANIEKEIIVSTEFILKLVQSQRHKEKLVLEELIDMTI